MEARSRNHGHSGKVISVKYYDCCVCGRSYPACKAHTLYYIVICGLSGCTIFFPHYLVNGTILRKTWLNIKCVF
jgi:hypothetical protein